MTESYDRLREQYEDIARRQREKDRAADLARIAELERERDTLTQRIEELSGQVAELEATVQEHEDHDDSAIDLCVDARKLAHRLALAITEFPHDVRGVAKSADMELALSWKPDAARPS